MIQTHQGGCHCKAVRYEVEIDLEQPVLECNCSYCQTKGFLLSFVPGDAFTLISGADELTEYRFNAMRIAHRFCKVCGVQAFGQGEKDGVAVYAINVRTLDDIEPDTLERMKVNGKDF